MRFLILFSVFCSVLLSGPVAAQGSSSVTPETQTRIDRFTRRMKDWGYYYGDLAGTENLGVGYDDEIKDGRMLIEGGDWAVYDRRLCSGAYGVSHEDASITPITLVSPGDYDTSCLTPTITSQVDAITLLKRYQWFSGLFIDWDHRLTPNPLNAGGWDGFESINASYDLEKPDLAGDPHLALYWLMHFGFTLDARYDAVKAIIETHNLAADMDVINDALAFFEHQSPYDDITITNSYADDADFTDIYLKRRSYLVYVTRSYAYASGADGLAAWWQSIDLYPQAERYMIQRMRWLGNNLTEHDQWQAFSDLVGQKPAADDISLLSYVQALNPRGTQPDRTQQATRFLNELITHEQLWKNPTERSFGQIMIWAIRDTITDKALLQSAVDIYFDGDSISAEFQDINAILNGPDANADIAQRRELVSQLTEADDNYDRFDATDAQRQAFWKTIDDTLDQARATSDDTLFAVISNLKDNQVQNRALRYLYTQDIPDKEQPFIDLYMRLEPSEHDMDDIFDGVFPQMFNGPDDPNILLARQLLFIPTENYRNDWAAENGRETATMFFLGTVHWPENFDFFMNILTDPQFNDPSDLKESIFRNLLSNQYDTDINSTNEMSQAQLETMLETISDVLRQPGWHDYRFFQEAIRSIYYLNNPLAKDWMEQHVNNQKWLNSFPNVDMGFDPLRYEINNAIESSLEFMAE